MRKFLCRLGFHKWNHKTHILRYCKHCRRYWIMPWVKNDDHPKETT